MIIEFLGVSGIGKTTIARKYKESLESEGKDVVWDTYDLYANQTWLQRNVKKALNVGLYTIRNPKWERKLKKYLEENVASKKDIIKPLFNGTYLKSVLDRANQDKKIHIFDEGSLHFLWAVKLRGKTGVTGNDILVIKDLFGLPNKLISISAKPEIIEDRLIHRHSYTRILDEKNMLQAIKRMQLVQKEIVNYTCEFVEIAFVNND